jgi:hypothetical protein
MLQSLICHPWLLPWAHLRPKFYQISKIKKRLIIHYFQFLDIIINEYEV